MSARKKRKTVRHPVLSKKAFSESKHVDFSYGAAIVQTITGAEADPATVLCLNGLVQGDGESERIGRKVILTSLHMKGMVTRDAIDGASMGDGSIVRILVLVDHFTQGVQYSSERVLDGDATIPAFAFRNLDYEKTFRILKDQTFELNATATGGNGTASDMGAFRKKFDWNFQLNVPVLQNLATGLVTGITDNSLHVLAISQGIQCTLNYESRVRYLG